MRIELDQTRIFRAAEAAKLARRFGDTDLGLVFYADTGEALPVSADERDLWLRHGDRVIERHCRHLRYVPFQVAAAATILLFAFQAAQSLLRGLVPELLAIPAPLAAVPAFVLPFAGLIRYKRQQADHARTLAEKLQFRMPVDAETARPHRRYNIFAAGSALIAMAALLWACRIAARGDMEASLLPAYALVPFAWLFHFAGRRVDAVHRRAAKTAPRLR